MPELRGGHDYHLAEPVKVEILRSTVKSMWRAQCDACGWIGPERERKYDAADDAAAHDEYENH